MNENSFRLWVAELRLWKGGLQYPISKSFLESKKISNDQEPIQADPTSCPKNQKEITKYINWQQFTKGTRGKPHGQLFSKQVVIQITKINKICH